MTNTESARVLYARTRAERFAIGAFNVDNLERSSRSPEPPRRGRARFWWRRAMARSR